MGAAFMCATALVLLLFPHSIATLWLPDSAANRDVLALAVTFLHVAAAFQLMDGSGNGVDEPARLEGRARADVGRGRVLLAGGCANVRLAWDSALA